MNRRDFLGAAATLAAAPIGAAALAQSPSTPPAAKPFKLKYAPHFGMFASHAPDDLDQIAFAADEGFLAWEDNGMAGRSIEFQTRFAQIMQKRGMQMGIFVAHQIDWQKPTLTTGDAAIRDRFVSDIKASTVVAQRINATWVTTVIGRVAQNLPFGHQFANVVDALRRAADVCEPSGMVMVVEPLNWRDHPGQFGNTSDVLRAVVKAVEHPSVKILQDLYHLQVTEGNLIDNMDRSWDDIAYFQLGDNPGRCEPGTGEVNYRNIFRHIHQRGYSGILGMEHGNSAPGKEGERKVIEAYRACDDFQA
jgi:hydroxypyruvate isomerase